MPEMIKVTIKLYATLRKYLPQSCPSNRLELELEEGTMIKELLEKLQIPAHEAKKIFVNSVIKEPSYVLQSGDQVGIFSPIGGG